MKFDNELDLLAAQPEWQRVLETYSHLQQQLRGAEVSEEAAGWVPRQPAITGIESGQLPAIHGKLIALGLLRFQLLSRTAGVVYQITPKGRDLLNWLRTGRPADDDHESSPAEDHFEGDYAYAE